MRPTPWRHDGSVHRDAPRGTDVSDAFGRVAGGVAHDVNNLLMVILCYVDLVLDRLNEESETRRDALEIKHAAESAARVTSDLVALSQHQELLPCPQDVSAIVRGMERTLRRAVGPVVNLVLELDEALPAVDADRGQIERIVMNLVVNARDAAGPGGAVTVATRSDARPAASASASPTRATAFLTRSARASSIRSSRPNPPARAQASASPSSGCSPRRRAAPSTCSAGPATARRSW